MKQICKYSNGSRLSRGLLRIMPVALCMAALTLPACKPTEKNYRAAYDAAKSKREAAEAEQMIPATGLLSDDGPELRIVEGDTLYVSRDRLRFGAGETFEGAYTVGVGVYRMDTNARAQAERLKEKGYDSRALQTSGDRWYCTVGAFATVDEARAFIKEFRRKNSGYPYIGLPGAPVVLRK